MSASAGTCENYWIVKNKKFGGCLPPTAAPAAPGSTAAAAAAPAAAPVAPAAAPEGVCLVGCNKWS